MSDDKLSPARGLLIGIPLAITLWVVIGLTLKSLF